MRRNKDDGQSEAAWYEAQETDVQPVAQWPVPPTRQRRRVPRWSRRVAIALAVVAALLASTSAVLAAFGTVPRLVGGSSAAVASRRATHVPTATLVPTPTVTLSATLTPTATENPLLTGGIDLGCGAVPLRPAPYVVRSGTAAFNEVALTFDDGPSADQTAPMLSILEQTHTPATFFVVGANVRMRPELVQREAADGFAIGIHTFDHPYMTKLTPSQRAWELSATAQVIHSALGSHYCLRYWRPPFDDWNSVVFQQTQAMGLTTVTWNVDPQDWSDPGVSVIVQRVLSAAHPGSIILLHDGYFDRTETMQALPQIIQGLRARGLVPVTLPQLLSGSPPATPTPTPSPTPTPAPATPTPQPTATATAQPTATATAGP